MINIPTVAAAYNDEMNHVDRGDQLRSYYKYDHALRRGPWQALAWTFLLDVALVNSYVAQLHGQPKWKRYTNHRQWRECIYNELFNAYGHDSQARQLYRAGDERDLQDAELQRKHVDREINFINRQAKSDCLACQGCRQGQLRTNASEWSPLTEVSGNQEKKERKRPKVLAGFLGTAWLAVGLVVVHYFVAFNPHENPFQMPGQATEDGRPLTANPIDVMATHLTRQVCQYFSLSDRTWIPIWLKGSKRWHTVFEKLMTGLGILISGYANLRCGISAYHFQLIAHLAWFSTVTHLAGLSALRQHLHRRPVEKWGRLFFMVVLAIMLLAAMFPTLFFNWAHDANQGSASFPGSNAICFFNASRAVKWHKERHAYNTLYTATNSHAFNSAIMSMILLILSLASLIFKAQDSVSHVAKSARKEFSDLWKRYIRRLKNGEQTSGLRLYSDLLISTLSDVYWLLVSAIWGTVKLFMAKSSAYVDEDDWTFGQILPIFLLLGPLVTTAAIFFEPQAQTCPPLAVTVEVNEAEGAGEVLTPMRAFNRDDEYRSHPAEPTEMPRFRQQVENFVRRNYYDFATCPWMPPAVALAFLQILTATVLMFIHLVKERLKNA
ncbi:hypothetical protein MRS44_018680 [Fusarium solani]|uniref:uncharacterized protein n=1 Tax=Fusarium solani TaxID=169388 RepID=UPI0032C40BCA|nr:hypothetical protein MRS44_018680 [Fusarium solani]